MLPLMQSSLFITKKYVCSKNKKKLCLLFPDGYCKTQNKGLLLTFRHARPEKEWLKYQLNSLENR